MRPYRDAYNAVFGGMPTTYFQVDIASGAVETIFEEPVFGSHHVQPCPSNPDIWLIDRDAPPNFWAGGDGEMTRAWLLNSKTKELVELDPVDPNGFQIHTNWNYRGDRVYYHGRSRQGDGKGHYVGVADMTGKIVWEQRYPLFYYGHMSTHTTKEAVITDGLLTPDLVTAIHYEDRDATGLPRVEALARHATVWGAAHGQFPHPHCHMSPDGRWLSYNRAEGWRSDVYVIRTG
jgi:hypothetical protein